MLVDLLVGVSPVSSLANLSHVLDDGDELVFVAVIVVGSAAVATALDGLVVALAAVHDVDRRAGAGRVA